MQPEFAEPFGVGDQVRAKYHGQLGVVVKVEHDEGDGYAKGSIHVLLEGSSSAGVYNPKRFAPVHKNAKRSLRDAARAAAHATRAAAEEAEDAARVARATRSVSIQQQASRRDATPFYASAREMDREAQVAVMPVIGDGT